MQIEQAKAQADQVKTESKIQEALKILTKDKTTIVIAHRLSTVINADKIVVIDNGQVIEQGSHNELLNKRGPYSVLYNSQFKN